MLSDLNENRQVIIEYVSFLGCRNISFERLPEKHTETAITDVFCRVLLRP